MSVCAFLTGFTCKNEEKLDVCRHLAVYSLHSMLMSLFLCPRTTFCAKTHDEQQVEISQDKVFVRCKGDSTKRLRRKHNRPVWDLWPLQYRTSLTDVFLDSWNGCLGKPDYYTVCFQRFRFDYEIKLLNFTENDPSESVQVYVPKVSVLFEYETDKNRKSMNIWWQQVNVQLTHPWKTGINLNYFWKKEQ